MTIEITNPEVEAMIHARLESGEFKNAEELISYAIQIADPTTTDALSDKPRAKDIVELFAPLRGLDIDFSRNRSTGRAVDL